MISDKIINYINLNVVALNEREEDKLRKFLEDMELESFKTKED